MKQSLEDIIKGQASGPFWMSVRHDIQSKLWYVEKHCQYAVDVLLRHSVWSSMEDSIINSFKHNLRVDVNSGLWQIK